MTLHFDAKNDKIEIRAGRGEPSRPKQEGSAVSMIRLTGDTHGERGRFDDMISAGELEWGADDVLMIGGDFGYIFANSPMENMFLDELARKPYTICFCDGNHENFPAIYAYPVEKWCGGLVHRIRKNVLHLMRGEVFDICGKRFFVMGGAYSRDKYMRYENLSWWPQELPSEEEYRNAERNLRDCGYRVDYILSHTAPRKIIRAMGGYPDPNDHALTGFFDWVSDAVTYSGWFFGHWHRDLQVDSHHRAMYTEVICLPE